MKSIVPHGGQSPLPVKAEAFRPDAGPFDGYPEPPAGPPGFRQYFGIIRRQWWVVALITLVFVGMAIRSISQATPQYRANSVVRLADTRQAMTGMSEVSAYEGVLGRETDVLLSQIQVLRSRRIAGSVVDREGLRLVGRPSHARAPDLSRVAVSPAVDVDSIVVEFGPADFTLRSGAVSASATYDDSASLAGVTLTVRERPETDRAVFDVISRDEAIGEVLGGFRASARRQTDIIDLEHVSPDPSRSQRIVNGFALAFQDHNRENARQTSRRRRIFLEEQMRQTQTMLAAAIDRYSGYRSGQRVFSSRERGSAQQQGLVALDMHRAQLNAQRSSYLRLLSEARAAGRTADAGLRALIASPGSAENPIVLTMYTQLSTLEARRDSMVQAGSAPANPDLIALNNVIVATRDRLTASFEDQIQSLNAQIDALDDLKAKNTAEIASAPSAETEEERLAQEVASVQKIASGLQEEFQRARMLEEVEAGQVEIIDPAELPTDPISEGRNQKLVLAFVVGLMFGVGAAVLKDGMNTSINRRDDIEKILRVPGLAVIPQFAGTGTKERLTRGLPGRLKSGNGARGARASGLVTVNDGRSLGAEAYRTLRTNLIFSQAVQTLRTIVVSSAAPSEGKTTTAANLAVSFAQQGMRVLIADCDLRKSRLHRVFGVAREPGLTELVVGHAGQDAVIRETAVPGLYVLPSGTLPPNPAELLGGARMRQTLASLSEAFDLIILDTPPLLVASDAAILSTLADGVILVVRAGVTESEAGQQAMQQLMSVGARVVGAVLNDPDSKVRRYGSHYTYEYGVET